VSADEILRLGLVRIASMQGDWDDGSLTRIKSRARTSVHA